MWTENENDVTNDLESTEFASNGGADITVPGISGKKEMRKILAPEEGNIIFDLTPTPTFLMNTDTSQICKLRSQKPLGLKLLLLFNGTTLTTNLDM